MSQLANQSLTARLWTSLNEGSVVDPASASLGAFTLDPEIARQRIRQARFSNPVRYVLELVQAAVLKGATQIAFRFEQGDLHMEFDGEPFSQTDYEQLYTSLLLKADSRTAQARQLLSLGLCTGLQLDPALIRLESGDVFIELRPGQPDRYGALFPPAPRTHIRVHERLSLGLLRRYVDHLGGHLTEEVLLQERCRYARVPIVLDGKLLSHYHSLPEVSLSRRFIAGDISGAVGISPYPQPEPDGPPPLESALSPTVLILVKCGVSVDSQLPLELLPGFRTLVESAAFHLDTSREHVVADSEYLAAMHQVLRAQLELLAALCRLYLEPPAVTLPETIGVHHLRALVRGLLLQLGGLLPLLNWAQLPLHAYRLADLPMPSAAWPSEVVDGAALLEVPIWQSISGEHICLSRLLRDFAEYQTVAHSAVRSDGLHLDRPLVVCTADPGDKEILQALFGKAMTSYEGAIQLAWERAHNKAAWQRRTHRPRLSGQVVIVRAPLTGPGITGEVGIEPHRVARSPWRRPLARPAWLRFLFIKDGSLLAEKKVPFPVPDLTVAVAADFTPSYRFDDILSDAQFSAVIDAVFQTLPTLIEQVSQLPPLPDASARAERTMPWWAAVLRPLFMLALSAPARQAARSAMEGGGSDKPTDKHGGPALPEQTLSEQSVSTLWMQLAKWPLFEALDGTPQRLDDLIEIASRDGYLAVLCPTTALPAAQLEAWAAMCQPDATPAAVWRATRAYSPAVAPAGERPAIVVWLSHSERALRDLITARFPELHVVDAEPWLRAVAMMDALHRERAATLPAAPENLDDLELQADSDPGLSVDEDAVPEEVTPEPRFHQLALPQACPVDSAADHLVAAIVEELRGRAAQGGPTDRLLKNVNLAWLQFGDDPRPLAVVCDSKHFIINRRHPAVQKVMTQSPIDPLYVGCLASAAYTALNTRLVASNEEDAARFIHRLAVRAATLDQV